MENKMNADVINTNENRSSGVKTFLLTLVVSAFLGLMALSVVQPNIDGAVNLLASTGLSIAQLYYVAGGLVVLVLVIAFLKRDRTEYAYEEDETEEVDYEPSYLAKQWELLKYQVAAISKVVWIVALLLGSNIIAAGLMEYKWMSHDWQYAMLVAFSLEIVAVALFYRAFDLDEGYAERQYFAAMMGLTMVGAAMVSFTAAHFGYKPFGIAPEHLFFYVAGLGFAVWLVAHPLCRLESKNLIAALFAFAVIFAPFWVAAIFMGNFGWTEITFAIPTAVFWAARSLPGRPGAAKSAPPAAAKPKKGRSGGA